jgi:hypothetical protein
MTHALLCVLSLDFREAFDRVAHQYLFAILKAYGLQESSINRIKRMSQDATSTVQINGHFAVTVPLRCSVRQGCPLSMALFALCINPLLHYLDTHLDGIRFGRNGNRVAVVDYADDVTTFVTQRDDFRIRRDALQCYGKGSGARLNIQKSKVLAIGGWIGTGNGLGVDFVPNMRILGITFSNTLERTAHDSWSRTAAQIRSQAQQANGRNMSTAQRINYIHNTLLAPIWYIGQTLPSPETYTCQLTTAVQWYLWRGAIFRVPLSTLQKPLMQGGWALLNMAVKCQALLLRDVWLQSQKEGTATVNWLQTGD